MNCEVQKNKKSLDEIEKLKKDIEQMSKVNHVEVLRLFKQNRIQLNENQNGVFINMTELDDAIIDKLQQYVEYVSSQHKELSQQEKVKENFPNSYYLSQCNLSLPINHKISIKEVEKICSLIRKFFK